MKLDNLRDVFLIFIVALMQNIYCQTIEPIFEPKYLGSKEISGVLNMYTRLEEGVNHFNLNILSTRNIDMENNIDSIRIESEDILILYSTFSYMFFKYSDYSLLNGAPPDDELMSEACFNWTRIKIFEKEDEFLLRKYQIINGYIISFSLPLEYAKKYLASFNMLPKVYSELSTITFGFLIDNNSELANQLKEKQNTEKRE